MFLWVFRGSIPQGNSLLCCLFVFVRVHIRLKWFSLISSSHTYFPRAVSPTTVQSRLPTSFKGIMYFWHLWELFHLSTPDGSISKCFNPARNRTHIYNIDNMNIRMPSDKEGSHLRQIQVDGSASWLHLLVQSRISSFFWACLCLTTHWVYCPDVTKHFF